MADRSRFTVHLAASALAIAVALGVVDRAVATAPDGFRPLAPGTLIVIPPDTSVDDTMQRGDILEITRGRTDREWSPKRDSPGATLIEQAKNRTYPRDVWCLEFAYKPPRLIDVDVPGPELKMRRKRLWYLLYRVKNVGGRRTVTAQDDDTAFSRERFETPVRFLPHFVLESIEGLSRAEGALSYRGYLDRVVPAAIEPIKRREAIPGRLHDSASMVETPIAPGEERWGVAIWEDIDPRIDFFSIYVRGLTNSIRWRLNENAAFAEEDPPGVGTDHALESLRLDFWRAGDEHDAAEQEVRIGHAGLLERMAIGVRVLEALSRPRLTKAQPTLGLGQLGLSWRDLLDPAVAMPIAMDHALAPSLAPLGKVITRLAAIKEPTARGPIVRTIFGDMGIEWIESLSRGLAEPVDPERLAVRNAALARAGVTAEALVSKPLESLAKVLAALDTIGGLAARRAEASALFGPAASRLDALERELATARAIALLDELPIDQPRLLAGGARGAYDAIHDVVGSEPDAAKRARLLRGLLGPEGPMLYAAATAVHEGIDHAWVFRYEIDADTM